MKHLMMIFAIAVLASAQTTQVSTSQVGCPAAPNGGTFLTYVLMTGPGTTLVCVPLDFSLQIINGKLTAVAPPSNNVIMTEVVGETPTGLINGTNKIFTLRGIPVAGTLKLYWNGLRQKEGVDYTITSSTITFTNTPEIRAGLLADYRK